MTQPTVNPGETYSERKLGELLDIATSDLQPGPGYKLTLQGVHATVLQHKELEAFFGASLDFEQGATIELGYHPVAEQLVLEGLSYPISGTDGTAQLARTDLIYVPIIEIQNQPFKTRGLSMSLEHGSGLLEGFGIGSIPSYDEERYSYWRDELLEKTKGWHLNETMTIPQAVTDDASQAVVLQHSAAYNHTDGATTESRSITRSITLFDSQTQSTSHIDVILSKDYEDYRDVVRAYKRTYRKVHSPIVIHDELVEDSRLDAVAIDEGTYHDFSNALNEAIFLRKFGPKNPKPAQP